jgi:DAK2 domain fusion protein YloV
MEKLHTLTGSQFKKIIESGANHLTNRYQEIDALNVFPVPDGDTGTNMNLTFSAGVSDALKVHSEKIYEVAKSLSKGLLMGARGNSGVILSQIFRGFYQSIDNLDEIDATNMANAFVKGSQVAYKAVMRPVEGTILTVLREAADESLHYTKEHPEISINEYVDFFIQAADKSLQNTPNLLPVLKEVGVVDSGGAGFLVIMEGFRYALNDQPVKVQLEKKTQASVQMSMENEEFGYCTEFIVRLAPEKLEFFAEDQLRKSLSRLGDSIVVVQDEDLVKVHVHTLTPGDALNLAQRHGEFVKLKIENMQEQHANILDHDSMHVEETPVPAKKYAIVAVAAGDGVAQAFKDLRVDVIISGGQTMNPATEDFVGVIEKLNAEHIFVLPNNSNIVLAAQQAESILDEQNIHVLMTKSIPQGLSACIMFNPEADVEENLLEMNDAIKRVKSGSITFAIKDTTINNTEIKANEFMGIYEKEIVISSTEKEVAIKALLDRLISDEDEIITVVAGEDATEAEIDMITQYIESNFRVEVELIEGNQPIYSFIFGVE